MKLGLKIVFLFMALVAGKELLAQNNLTYKQLIEEADLYMKAGDIGFARIDYDKAIAMNPSDEYPRIKLAEIDRKASEQHRNDSIFEQSLLNAEKYFKAGNYNLAQIEYKRSLELKPGSEFIKDRLAIISASASNIDLTKTDISSVNLKAEAQKASNTPGAPKSDPPKQEIFIENPVSKTLTKDNKLPVTTVEEKKKVPDQLTAAPTPLQTALNQGDDFLAAKDYNNAVQRYQAALALKSGDKAIMSKLSTTQALLDKQKKDQQAYNDIILAAEKAVASKNTQLAVTYYEKAAAINPDNVVLGNILITLRDQLSVELNLEKDFKAIIAKANVYMNDNNLSEAKKAYEQARSIKPEDKYPQDKLLEFSKIEAITEAENSKKYKETIVLAESLLSQEDYQGAYQSFSKASALQPKEVYPKQKMTELTAKMKELEAQYKIAYIGYITDADKAFQTKNWDIAMDNYLKALKAKPADTLSANQINRIITYLDKKSILTLIPSSPTIAEGIDVKLSFKAIDVTKRTNHYLLVCVKNSGAGNPRLYINYGQDAQKNGGIVYRNLVKGGQNIDYVIRIVNQDRWYRLDNNWITLTVEGGTLEIENLKVCADI
jgi:tetratricopeptide (TPR) repeat protein